LPRVGAADRLRSWGRKIRDNPWLAVGIVTGVLLICAWIGWAIHVASEHSARQGLGALLAWAAIAAIVALISVPFIWAFRVIRASRSDQPQPDPEPESSDTEVTEPG
jgi:type VI protein secretion system component VasK